MEDNEQESSTFKPTRLIDTSDMSVVPGSTVSEPYYTLSYSWNQSGDYFKNEHDDGYTRIDRGLHQIVLDPTAPDTGGNEAHPARVRYVKFEELVQEICQDFGVRYLWWDQWCIDQSNKEEKRREITQMHRIYENACRTIVLVPEYRCKYRRLKTMTIIQGNLVRLRCMQWFKRVWTMVEAFKSDKLLFVGRNVHMYSETIDDVSSSMRRSGCDSLLCNICLTSKKWSACLALSHFQGRTTTKRHDYYFAFANMFPKKLDTLKFSYDQDIQEVALEFYQRLAQNDPTILFFGAPNKKKKFERKMLGLGLENSCLPSWTGICGVHSENTFRAGEHNPSSFGLSDGDYIVSGSTIKVTCASIPISIMSELEFSKRRLDDIPAVANVEWRKAVTPYILMREKVTSDPDHAYELRLSGTIDLTFVAKPGVSTKAKKKRGHPLNTLRLKETHFLPCMMDSSYRYHNVMAVSEKNWILAALSLTEYCDHCIILYGLRYAWKWNGPSETVAPVITKDGDHYKSIGLCVFNGTFTFPDIDTETKQTFVIR